jgi:mono/diheme cytochrome c family protein
MKTSLILLSSALVLPTLACSLFSNNAAQLATTPDSPESAAADKSLPEELQNAFNELPAGDAASGEQIFAVSQPCHVCHTDQPIGPSFQGEQSLASLAATRRQGYPADIYLYESIVNPSAFVVPGYQDSIMPQNFAELLSKKELADLVAYLMTMR